MAELPPLLTQIENQYDFDRLTPLFRQHQSNLDKFQSKTQPPALKKELTIRTNSQLQAQEKDQKRIFSETAYAYQT